MAREATRGQLFGLFAATGKVLELRNLGPKLTFDMAQSMLSRIKDQGENPDTIKAELIGLGATDAPRLNRTSGKSTPRETKPKVDYQAIYDEADRAGRAAAEAHTPTPMVVARHANPLDDRSPVQQSWTVPGGVCGFAWISFKGNTAWGRWTKKQGLSSKDYPTGLMIWVSDYNQSMELKEKYAAAFTEVLRKHGITAYMRSRMD